MRNAQSTCRQSRRGALLYGSDHHRSTLSVLVLMPVHKFTFMYHIIIGQLFVYEFVGWGGGGIDSVRVEVGITKSLELFSVRTMLYSMKNVMLVFIITAGSNEDQDVWDVIVVVATGMNIEKKLCRLYTTQCNVLGKTTALATNQITLIGVIVIATKPPHLEI